jgi:hypothetical protein
MPAGWVQAAGGLASTGTLFGKCRRAIAAQTCRCPVGVAPARGSGVGPRPAPWGRRECPTRGTLATSGPIPGCSTAIVFGTRGCVLGAPGPEGTPEKPAVCKEDLNGTDIRCHR